MENPKENASSEFGTLTGRLKSQGREWPDPFRNTTIVPPSYLREAMAALVNNQDFEIGVDLSKDPGFTGVMLVKFDESGKLVYEHLAGIQGKTADLVIIDEMAPLPESDLMAMLDFSEVELRTLASMQMEEITRQRYDYGFFKLDHPPERFKQMPYVDPEEPMKQNGRSAAYLQHDPSKRRKNSVKGNHYLRHK